MLFNDLVTVFQQLEQTTSSNKMQEILAELFKKVPRGDMDKVCYFTLGSIASKYEGVVLGVADNLVVRAIAYAASVNEMRIKERFKKLGDLGDVAGVEIQGKGKRLTIAGVFSALHAMAEASGSGSMERKVKELADVLSKASSEEAKYIVRIALGTLRLGVGGMTLLNALAIAFSGEKENKEVLERAYNLCPDVGIIAKTLVARGVAGVRKIGVVVGRPVQMMLCQRASTLEEIKKRMPAIAAEEKYDGERVQIHKKGKKITFFSRRLDDITSQFPDVLEDVKKLKGDFIIEGEIVPLDKKTGAILTFQTLMQRKRKYDIEKYAENVPVAVFLFDCLCLNGRSVINQSLDVRRLALHAVVGRETGRLKYARNVMSADIDEIESFFNECVQRGTEGIIAKNPKGAYRAGTRGYLWIKWKREYAKEMRDTFDVVVVGAFAGRGKRGGTYGALLCAVYNKEKDRFETFCKLGSGFTDKQLSELPRLMKLHEVRDGSVRLTLNKNIKPDVFFEPKVVIEVTGAEITRSPVHTAAERNCTGLALRFPRFLRFRADKKPEQATTTKEIQKLSR